MVVEPTKEIAFTSGCSSSASTASLSPWTTLNTPSGRPARLSRSAIISDADGSSGLGLSTKQLPAAMATGYIHIGTITGKVERGDAGHHAQRLAHRPVVDAGGHLVGVVALEQLRDAAGELHDVDAAGDFALGVGEYLAMLGRDGMRQLVLFLVQQLQELEHHPGPADRRRVGPGGEGRLGGGHGVGDLGVVRQRDLAGDGAGGGVEDFGTAAALAGDDPSADPVLDGGDGGVRQGFIGSVHWRGFPDATTAAVYASHRALRIAVS